MSESPLINLGELSKPATVLVEKISEAVGGLFKPWQIVRVTRAEAAADQIRVESQIQISDLQRRAVHRFLVEEGKKQSNIEDITQKALPLLHEESKPQEIENDWITNFFDKCRIVSDEDMRQIWSAVLAGKANSPGAFSRRTVNLLSDLEKRDAELFTKLCGFIWIIGDENPLIFDFAGRSHINDALKFDELAHLESLGLVQLENVGGFVRAQLPQNFTVYYFGRAVYLKFPVEGNISQTLNLGRVLLTQSGRELSRVCKATPVEGLFEMILGRWRDEGWIIGLEDPPETHSSA